MADAHTDDYRHGEMNSATQAADFRLFATFAKWGSLHVAVLILVLTLWFCTDAGFLTALITGAIVLAIGITVLRSKPRQVH